MKTLVIDPNADVIVVDGNRFVKAVVEAPDHVEQPQQPAPPQQRSGGKQGPRPKRDNESDVDYAARVKRYDKRNKPQVAPQESATSLPTREASDKPKPKGFVTTLCKCRGDFQTAKKQGTYGKPDFVAAVYSPTQDFKAFGIESPLEIPQGVALCGTFRKKDSDETFEAAVYHTGNGTRNGDWMQLLFYDEATGEAKGGNGRPLFKANADIVQLFLMPCNCDECKAKAAA